MQSDTAMRNQVDDTKVTLYADWADNFLHLDSITQIDHFDGIMKRPCQPKNAYVMKFFI